MRKFMAKGGARRFRRDESGATAIEYVLVIALVAFAIIGAIGAVGDRLGDNWDDIKGRVVEAGAEAGVRGRQ